MNQILDEFGGAIADIINHPIVQLAVQGVLVYAIALWLAAAFWAFRDMRCRTVNPVVPYLAAAGIILFTPLLFPLAVIVYRILRPQETISEAWERHMAEQAMRAELDATTCAGCGRRVDEEWLACPTCGTRLSRRCVDCGRAVALDWSLCAWCGRDFGRVPERTAIPETVPTARAIREAAAPPPPVVDEPVAIPIFGALTADRARARARELLGHGRRDREPAEEAVADRA